jgi:hypothetical protein
LNERENVRTPARNSADAIVSPGAYTILRPSKSKAPLAGAPSLTTIEVVGERIAFGYDPPAAARVVKPTFALDASDVGAQPDSVEIGRERVCDGRCVRVVREQFATEPELRVKARAAVGAGDPHKNRSLTPARRGIAA